MPMMPFPGNLSTVLGAVPSLICGGIKLLQMDVKEQIRATYINIDVVVESGCGHRTSQYCLRKTVQKKGIHVKACVVQE